MFGLGEIVIRQLDIRVRNADRRKAALVAGNGGESRIIARNIEPVGVDLLDEVEMRGWEVLKEAIRAALLVLREPTPEILNAFSDGDIESEKYWYIHYWKIMMDEVLKE